LVSFENAVTRSIATITSPRQDEPRGFLIAHASAGRNVIPNPSNRGGFPVGLDLRPHRCFRFTEAVADLAISKRLFVPHADPHVARCKPHVA
jgi:hypothetical protein